MKIEQGKYYRTRNGRKAYCGGYGSTGCPIMTLPGADSTTNPPWVVWPHGYASCETPCSDIVSEWQEPVTHKVDLILLKSPHGKLPVYNAIPVGERHQFGPCYTELARKTVEFVVGDGV